MSEKRGLLSITGVVSIATIITTVLTQVPAISSYFRPVMYILWILALLLGLINNRAKIPSHPFLLLFAAVVIILWIEYLFNMSTHVDSYIIRILPLPLLCYLVGILYARRLDRITALNCLIALFITSFLMFSYIFLTYIGNFSTWLNANYYIYEQKNSAAQIIGCTIILTAFLIKPSPKWLNIGRTITLVFLFLIIIAMQCRAALIALIVTAAVYYIAVLRGKQRFAVSIISIIVLIVFFNNDVLSKYVYKAFVFNERQTRNLDYFTSGRLTNFRYAWELFKEHYFVGTGHHRVDNLYLCILSDVGLVGFIPILILWVTRIIRNISIFYKEKNPFSACVLCLTVFYFCESFAEAYPPFGPGVCAFMFWVICAFVDMKVDYTRTKNRLEE